MFKIEYEPERYYEYRIYIKKPTLFGFKWIESSGHHTLDLAEVAVKELASFPKYYNKQGK
jgi:hypothetical protein